LVALTVETRQHFPDCSAHGATLRRVPDLGLVVHDLNVERLHLLGGQQIQGGCVLAPEGRVDAVDVRSYRYSSVARELHVDAHELHSLIGAHGGVVFAHPANGVQDLLRVPDSEHGPAQEVFRVPFAAQHIVVQSQTRRPGRFERQRAEAFFRDEVSQQTMLEKEVFAGTVGGFTDA